MRDLYLVCGLIAVNLGRVFNTLFTECISLAYRTLIRGNDPHDLIVTRRQSIQGLVAGVTAVFWVLYGTRDINPFNF